MVDTPDTTCEGMSEALDDICEEVISMTMNHQSATARTVRNGRKARLGGRWDGLAGYLKFNAVRGGDPSRVGAEQFRIHMGGRSDYRSSAAWCIGSKMREEIPTNSTQETKILRDIIMINLKGLR